MAIKIDGQSDNIKDFKVQLDGETNTRPVTLVRNGINGPILYARPGLLELIRPGTSLPTHVTSLVASRASFLEPSASTGPLTPIEGQSSYYRVYHGDVLNFTLTPEVNWQIDSYTTQATLNFLTDTKVYGNMKIEPVSVSRIMHDVSIEPAANSNFKVNYYNEAGNWVTVQGTTAGSVSAWQGQTVSWSAAANNFYKYAANPYGSFTLTGATTISYGAPAMAERPNLHLNSSAHATLTVTYTNTSGTTSTYTATHAETHLYDVWQGSAIDFSVATDDFCSATVTYSHIEPTTSAASIEITSTALPRTLSVRHRSPVSFDVTVYYNNTNFTPTSSAFSPSTVTHDLTIWQGGEVTYTYTQPSYYDTVVTSSNLEATSSNASLSLVTNAATRMIFYTLGDGVANITMTGNDDYVLTKTSSGATMTWQGYSWSFAAGRATYWTNATVSPASATKGADTINITSSAIPYNKNVSYIAGNTTSVTVTYYTDPTHQTTTHPTNTLTIFSAWTGGAIEYAWTGAQYYLSGSETLDATENQRGIIISPGKQPGTVEVTGTSHRTITATGEKTSSSAALTHSTSDATASWDDYWSGAKVDWTVDYEQYWTGTETGGSIAASEDTRTIDVSATKAPRNLYLYPSEHATIQAWYDNIGGTGGYLKADHADASTDNLWQGGSVSTYTVAADEFCTYSLTTANLSASESDASITANVTGLTRSVIVRNTDTSKILDMVVTYKDSNFNDVTQFIQNTTYHNYTMWQGDTVGYTYSLPDYYEAEITSANLGPTSSQASLTISPKRLNRDINFTLGDGISKLRYHVGVYEYSITQSGSTSVWQGSSLSFGPVSAATYWTSPTVSPTEAAAGSATVDVTASAVRQLADVTVAEWEWAYGVVNFFIDGLDVDANPTSSGTIYGNITFSDKFWSGGELNYSGTAAQYWTMVTGTVAASTATRTLYPHADRDMGPVQITGTKPTGLNSLTLTGVDRTKRPFNYATYTVSSAGTLYGFWAGASVTWSASYAEGYTGTASGSVGASSSTRTINWPTPSLQAVYFYNNSGRAVYVGGTVVMSGNTYAYVFTSSQSVSITCSAAASTSKYVTTSNYGSTYTITTTIGSQYVDSVTKSKGPTSASKTFYKPAYASGAATSSSWEVDSADIAEISSHSGGPYGYDQITVTVRGAARFIATADVYYLSVSKLAVS